MSRRPLAKSTKTGNELFILVPFYGRTIRKLMGGVGGGGGGGGERRAKYKKKIRARENLI